jgi:hypothetical protein
LLFIGFTVLVGVLAALAASRPSLEGRKVLNRPGVPGAHGLEPGAEEARTEKARKGRDAQDYSARARLKIAHYLIQNGETDTAAKRLKRIIEDFPGTQYAKEAKKLLDGLEKQQE